MDQDHGHRESSSNGLRPDCTAFPVRWRSQQPPIRSSGTATASTDSDSTVPNTHFTPSLGAVPSLSARTFPLNVPAGYYSNHQSQTHTLRSKSQYGNALTLAAGWDKNAINVEKLVTSLAIA
ncbi:MAG: hypothetical protein Q9200_000798 [Gallowayella weberi]